MKILQIIDYQTFKEDYLKIAEKVKDKADFIWFRIKNLAAKEIYEKAKMLCKIVDRDKLILSERPDIASILGFWGVQLNDRSLPVYVVKEKFPALKVGYSAHSLKEISLLAADFFTLSPIFDTPKEYHINPIGLNFDLPDKKKVFALGGISAKRIELLKNKGFFGIAGIRFYNELDEIKKLLR